MLGWRAILVLTVWPLYLSRPLALAGRSEGTQQVDGQQISRAIQCPTYEILLSQCCTAAFVATDVNNCCVGVNTSCYRSSNPTSSLLSSPTGLSRSYDEDAADSDDEAAQLASSPSAVLPRTTMLSRMAYFPPSLDRRQVVDNSTSLDLLTDVLNCGTIGHACNGTCIDPASTATPSCNQGSCQTACVASVAALKSNLSLSQVGGGLIGSLAGIVITNVGIPYFHILRKRYLEHVKFHVPRIFLKNRGRGTPVAIWAPLTGHGATGWG